MDWLSILYALLFTGIGVVCVVLIPVGLPGTWVLLGLAVVWELTDAALLPGVSHAITFGWPLLGICTGIAVVGELIEAGTGVAGARMGGATRRGIVGSLVGGLVGAIAFTPLIPIPLIGTLVGALVGTFAGAFIGETTGEVRRHPGETLRAAAGAAAGRLVGTFGKVILASAILVMLVRAAFESPAS